MADEYGNALASIGEETAAELVELALAIGQGMARDCIQEDPQVIARVVKTILESDFAPAARPQLLLNPADLGALEDALGDELASQGWQLQPDDKITRGGCLLKNDLSEIDATWESRWRTISSRVRRRQAEPGSGDDTAATEGDS